MSMSGCIASVTGRYAFVQFKEQSNAKQSGKLAVFNPFFLFFLAKSC